MTVVAAAGLVVYFTPGGSSQPRTLQDPARAGVLLVPKARGVLATGSRTAQCQTRYFTT